MPNVPKIVPERLKAAASSAAHPDADLLTAFAEQALPEAERKAVLDHLARCRDCRDVVALALPPTEAVQTTTTPVRSTWLTWPTLRWAFVAAGVVTIASIGALQFQRHSQQSMMAYKSPQVALPESAAQPQAAPATAAPNESRDEKQDKNESVRVFSDSESSPTAVVVEPKLVAPSTTRAERFGRGSGAGIGAGVAPHGGPKPPALFLQNNSQFQNNAQQSNAWQQAPASASAASAAKQSSSDASSVSRVPATNQTVEVSGAAPQIATETKNQEAQGVGQINGLQLEYSKKLSKAKNAPSPRADVVSNNQPGGDQSARALKLQAASGQVGGYVVDPSGAVVSNARITVTPSNSGGTATTVTNSQGAWLIAGLAPGLYRAQAEAPGFKTSVLDFNYDARQPSTFSFTLSPGSASEMVEVSSQNALVQTEGANVGNTISTQQISQLPASGRNVAHIATLSPGLLQSPPRWAINAAGGLQRSFDQGKTWQDVNVIATSVPSSSFATAEIVSKDKDYAKEADRKRAAKTPSVIFRAVVANGTDVWAGGSAAALYHSIDAGSHWTRVIPSASGAALTGDIVSLEFSDPQHGKITTSVPEAWTTADAGQTWQKQ